MTINHWVQGISSSPPVIFWASLRGTFVSRASHLPSVLGFSTR